MRILKSLQIIAALILLSGCFGEETDILVIDYGSPATPKIIQRMKDLDIVFKVVKQNVTDNEVSRINPKGIILSGSPESVMEGGPLAPPVIYTMDKPILGICYGLQIMSEQLDGKVVRCPEPEIGVVKLTLTEKCSLYPDDLKEIDVWMYHYDCISKLPTGFVNVGYTELTNPAIACNEEKKWYGVQFHPERFDKTPEAARMIDRFVYKIVLNREAKA